MSLWTPGGEHEVPREQPKPTPSEAGGEAGGIDPIEELLAALSPEDRAQLAAMSPEERARAEDMLVEMATVQMQMAETPAAVVVANHAMGLYELATIHLRQQPPNFGEAQIAIDAFAALTESLKGKLGPDEGTLGEALTQIRLAFVQLRQATEGSSPADAVTVLVTGGAGYIGSHTVRLLREQGRDVVVLDSMEYGHQPALLGAPLVVGGIDDAALVARTVADHDVDSVIHFAAYKAAGESMEQPGRYFANNVGGTNALLDALRLAGVDRIVFSSTCAVYGTPTALPVDESHPLGPESPYGESKRMVEQMLAWYSSCHALRSVSLRYFNAAGASADGLIGEDWTYTLNLVPLVMKAALGRVPAISVFGTDYDTPDGTAIRDYVHVEDLADAHIRALDYLADGGPTTAINLGTGTGSSVKEVIDAAKRVSGIDIPTIEAERRAGDPVAIYGDNRRAAEVLGWHADRNLTTVVTSAWNWHSTHPDGYRD